MIIKRIETILRHELIEVIESTAPELIIFEVDDIKI